MIVYVWKLNNNVSTCIGQNDTIVWWLNIFVFLLVVACVCVEMRRSTC